MPKKKKKEKLKPQAESRESEIEIEELKNLMGSIDKFDIEPEKNKNETFYKMAIQELFNEKSIETKTEWLNASEVTVATALQFMGIYGDIPIIAKFVTALEKKRVSLKRKGREEIIMALQERREEEIEIRKAQIGRVM